MVAGGLGAGVWVAAAEGLEEGSVAVAEAAGSGEGARVAGWGCRHEGEEAQMLRSGCC